MQEAGGVDHQPDSRRRRPRRGAAACGSRGLPPSPAGRNRPAARSIATAGSPRRTHREASIAAATAAPIPPPAPTTTATDPAGKEESLVLVMAGDIGRLQRMRRPRRPPVPVPSDARSPLAGSCLARPRGTGAACADGGEWLLMSCLARPRGTRGTGVLGIEHDVPARGELSRAPARDWGARWATCGRPSPPPPPPKAAKELSRAPARGLGGAGDGIRRSGRLPLRPPAAGCLRKWRRGGGTERNETGACSPAGYTSPVLLQHRAQPLRPLVLHGVHCRRRGRPRRCGARRR